MACSCPTCPAACFAALLRLRYCALGHGLMRFSSFGGLTGGTLLATPAVPSGRGGCEPHPYEWNEAGRISRIAKSKFF